MTVALGWIWLGQSLSLLQGVGATVVLGSVWFGQNANQTDPRMRQHALYRRKRTPHDMKHRQGDAT
ncbi:MAG: DMT family transporter [Paracoccaceae bacterium]